MDPNVLVAIIGMTAAIVGSIVGTVPMYLAARNNNQLIEHRLLKIEEMIKELQAEDKEHNYDADIAEIKTRLDGHDDHIARLSQYHLR